MEKTINATRKLQIKWLVSIIVSLSLLLIPTSELFSMQLKLFLVITVLSMFMLCFELMEPFWVAIFLPGCWILFGVCTVEDAFKPWTTTTIWMIVGGFLLANALDECGVLKRFSYWCLKKCNGSFNKIIYAAFLVGVLIAYLTFGNGFMITFLLGYSICKVFKQINTKAAAVVMLAAQLAGPGAGAYICNPKTMAFFSSGINGVLPDFNIQWYHQIIYSIPLLFISLIVIFILTKIYKTKNISSSDAVYYFEDEYKKLGPMTSKEKKASFITFIIIAYLILSSFVGLDTNLGLVILPLLYFLPGINVASKDALKKVNFNMVVFVASCMAIGQVGSNLGLGNLISQSLLQVLLQIPIFLTPLAVLIGGIIGNLFMTPSAMFSLFPAPLTQIAVDLGMSTPWPLNFSLMYVNDLVFFPYEQSLCLIIMSFGVVRMNDFIKVNIIRMGIFIVCFMLLVIPWWYLLGLF